MIQQTNTNASFMDDDSFYSQINELDLLDAQLQTSHKKMPTMTLIPNIEKSLETLSTQSKQSKMSQKMGSVFKSQMKGANTMSMIETKEESAPNSARRQKKD